MKGLFITGTDTGVGKTVVTAILALGLRKLNLNVCPVKPVSTGGIEENGHYISEDAEFYQKVTGVPESLVALSPLCFKKPASPHLAAGVEGQVIKLPDLLSPLETLSKKYDGLIVEGVGGWLVPLSAHSLVADFAKLLQMPVIIVSANRLGSINHTLLTITAIRGMGMEPLGVIFSSTHPDIDPEIVENNVSTIVEIGAVPVLGTLPYLAPYLLHNNQPEGLWAAVKDEIQWNKIIPLVQ